MTSVTEPVLRRERASARSSARWRIGRLVQGLVLLTCVLLFLGAGLYEAWADAPTFDEPVYVAAGLQAVLHHDLVIND